MLLCTYIEGLLLNFWSATVCNLKVPSFDHSRFLIFNWGQIRLMCNFWATVFWTKNLTSFSLFKRNLSLPLSPIILCYSKTYAHLNMIRNFLKSNNYVRVKNSNLEENQHLFNKIWPPIRIIVIQFLFWTMIKNIFCTPAVYL